MATDSTYLGDYQPPTRLGEIAQNLRHWGHRIAMVPVLGWFFAPAVAAVSGCAAVLDTVDGFVNKSVGDGIKNAVSGSVDTVANTVVSGFNLWMPANYISALASGDTLPEHAHNLSKQAMNAIFPANPPVPQLTVLNRQQKVLGNAPMTYGSTVATVASPSHLMQQQMATTGHISPTGQDVPPNFWSDREAQRRGQSPEEARANWVRNNHEDAVALNRAAQTPAELGAS